MIPYERMAGFPLIKKNYPFWVASVLSLVFCFLKILCIDACTVPWVDEVWLTDAAASFVSRGEFISHVWPYTYNPLHFFILTGWLFVFGISHFTVVCLGIFLAALSIQALLFILWKRKLITGVFSPLILVLCFWCASPLFSGSVLNGRVDMLVVLCTILFLDQLLRVGISLLKLCITASLALLSAVYQFPVLVFFCLMLWMFPMEGVSRREWFRRGCWIASSCIATYLLICLFYICNHTFFRFVYTYVFFNNTINGFERSLADEFRMAYLSDAGALCLFAASVLMFLVPGIRKAGGGGCSEIHCLHCDAPRIDGHRRKVYAVLHMDAFYSGFDNDRLFD